MERFGYVKDAIVDLDLDPRNMNSLPRLENPVAMLRQAFRNRGWSVRLDPQNTKRSILSSPSGEVQLWQSSGKVWRHPETTETLCKSKDWTSRLLRKAGVPVARGLVFDPDEKSLAKALWRDVADRVVVKPSNSGQSRGVTVGVDSDSAFEMAWDTALSVRTSRSKVLVEEVMSGFEVRCFVVGDRVVSSNIKFPSFVIGDGRHCLSELVEEAELARSRHARYAKAGLKPDWNLLSSMGLGPDSVPSIGAPVVIAEFPLFRLGDYAAEVSDVQSPRLREIAIAGRNAIPNLEVAAVDILTEDVRSGKNARVLEINTAPALSHHIFPAFGTPKDLPGEIAEYFNS